MSVYPIFEALVMGGIAAYCAVVLCKRFAPKQVRALAERWRGLPGSRFATWLVPPASCDDGCATCSKCADAPKTGADVHVVSIHRSPRA